MPPTIVITKKELINEEAVIVEKKIGKKGKTVVSLDEQPNHS